MGYIDLLVFESIAVSELPWPDIEDYLLYSFGGQGLSLVGWRSVASHALCRCREAIWHIWWTAK